MKCGEPYNRSSTANLSRPIMIINLTALALITDVVLSNLVTVYSTVMYLYVCVGQWGSFNGSQFVD